MKLHNINYNFLIFADKIKWKNVFHKNHINNQYCVFIFPVAQCRPAGRLVHEPFVHQLQQNLQILA